MSLEKWQKLLCNSTFRNRSATIDSDGRNIFEQDYGRLISSSPIRRLQDKTQVFPLEQSDFIRTRLTHSLEVSYIGSSIGTSIEKYLIDKKHLTIDQKGFLSSLLRVAGLVHDLGNPPFGHFGEEAIQSFFRTYFEKNKSLGLNAQQMADFVNFDGNAQAFRILRRLHYFGDEHSYNLTFPSLASIIKYPSTSTEGNQKKKAKEIRKKKFGYFVSEESDYQIINELLELNNKRHPIVYLLEAADDIAYCAADLEDGVKLGIISINDIREVFGTNLKANIDLVDFLNTTYEEIKANRDDVLSTTIQKFRVKTQSKMIEGIIGAFKDNYEDILNGNFQKELIEESSASDIRSSYKKLQSIVFENKKIMIAELAGWEAIYGLLEIFIPSLLSPEFDPKNNPRDSRLYKIISSSYRFHYEKFSKKWHDNDNYNKIQLVIDFISGMTDSYAISIYQKLKGIST